MLDSPLFDQIGRYLDLAARRQELIVSNMANVDTPGYRTRDLDFESELQRAASGQASSSPGIVQVEGLLQRPDGNNVSVDREALLLAQTQLEFRMGAQLLKHKFQMLENVIKEGGTGS
jgi:flagellar basal-body rod protein FlgB